jgi:uncharacterized membrane protein YvlD (DUF360 family)
MEKMKDILRESLVRSVTLYAAAAIFPGLVISRGAGELLLSGAVFTLFSRLVSPLVKLITLPFNLLTLGLFSWINHAVVLAIMVQFWRHVQVIAFRTTPWQQSGFSIPAMEVSLVFSYIMAAILLTFIYKILDWLCQY